MNFRKKMTIICTSAIIIFTLSIVSASDWPIYKGNIFFTGNNDEITVKNNNLKWLYQADEVVYNPIASDGRIYFLDLKKNIYCLNEDTGKLIWRFNLKKISQQFHARSRTAGKVKYPLVKGNSLFITDSYVIYCFDKRTGRVIWARTGMRQEKEILDRKSSYGRTTDKWQPGNRSRWDPGKGSQARVDGIYSDPVIHEDTIYYGTRNVFMSREIVHGRFKWNNKEIKSWSGFPSFYDKYIFTQSMNYSTGKYTLYCMSAHSGEIVWKKDVTKPVKIYSPVVNQRRVFLASGSWLYSIDLRDGKTIWEKDYGEIITSNPSFTEREILFTTGNRKIVIIRPVNGSIVRSIDLGEKSRPFFVTIRDQVYVANTFKKKVGKRMLSYASLKALNYNREGRLWEFIPPFPGGSYQPAASKGIMFLPAGNYLYAVGTDYYPRVVDGGSTTFDPKKKKSDDKKANRDRTNKKKDDIEKKDPVKKKITFRPIKINVEGNDGDPVSSTVEIKKWVRGKLVYSKRVELPAKGGVVDVPDTDDVEVTASSKDHLPRKVIVSRKDRKKTIRLDRIEKGRGIIVDNVHFEINEAYLRKESLNILDQMINAMKRNRRLKIEIRGHTDSTGSRKHNMRLSMRRADAVKDYMIKNGISPERLQSAGLGPDKPIASNKTEEGRSRNRRTEFFILDK